MSDRNVVHNTFVVERTYDAPPNRVFEAFSDLEIKRAWFGGPEGWQQEEHTLDFRIGGRERAGGGPPGGPVHRYEAVYHDIVPNRRIVSSYEMYVDKTRSSVSLATLEFVAEGRKTRLICTEQGVFLDGLDHGAAREEGTGQLLGKLAEFLRGRS